MIAHMYGMTVDGRWVPMIVDDQGYSTGSGGGAPAASSLAGGWKYTAASGGIADTTPVEIKAAAGLGRFNYIKSLQLMNSDVSVATEVELLDGSTVLWRGFLPALAASTAPVPVDFKFDPPLVGSQNTALNVKAVTTSAQLYVNAQGYVGGAPNQVALNTNTGDEVYDIFGALVTDISGSTIILSPYQF
jgi:hypothetical protein